MPGMSRVWNDLDGMSRVWNRLATVNLFRATVVPGAKAPGFFVPAIAAPKGDEV